MLFDIHAIVFNASYFHKFNVSILMVVLLSFIVIFFLLLLFWRFILVTISRCIIQLLLIVLLFIIASDIFLCSNLTVNINSNHPRWSWLFIHFLVIIIVSIFLVLDDILHFLPIHRYLSCLDHFLFFLHLLVNFAVD